MASNTPPPPRRMSRLRAEKIVLQAFRIANLGHQDASSSAAVSTASGPRSRLASQLSSRETPGSAFSPGDYLQQSGVQFFIEDLLKRLQEQRPEHPATFIGAYFASIMKGTHVIGRSFEFINGTMQNRIAFVSLLHKTFSSVDPSMQLTLDDFTELIRHQCSDFSKQTLLQSAYHLKESNDSSHARSTLRAFLVAFSACFFYNACRRGAARDPRGSHSRTTGSCSWTCSFVSTVRRVSISIANAMAADRVVARLRIVAQQANFSIPPMLETEAIVYKSNTFKEVRWKRTWSTLPSPARKRHAHPFGQFCTYFYESPVVAASISDLQRAFQTLDST
ncbi:hypothetical protein PybrP1_011250, partial [[Pythium] brassicae (nom. inval.)]